MAFDRGPIEFPVASMRPREPAARAIALLASGERWLQLRWAWLRPRTVPVAVAALGMVAVLAATNYLAHFHGDHDPSTKIVRVDLAHR